MNKRVLDYLIGVPIIWFLSLFNRINDHSLSHPEKVLVIKLAAVGDIVLMTPILKSIKNKWNEIQIDFVCSPVNSVLTKNIPYINNVFVFNPKRPYTWLFLIWKLRKQKYSVVLDYEQWSRGSALLAFFVGAAHRFGFRTDGQHRHGLYTKFVDKTKSQHEIDDFFILTNLLGNINPTKQLEIFPTPAGEAEAQEIFDRLPRKSSGPLILIHPGCGWDGAPREWPISDYAILAHWLMKAYNATLLLTSGPEETIKIDKLNKLLNHKAFSTHGRLSWNGIVSLVKRVDGVISGNTGIMHIAAAWGKKQIALHGPTNPHQWGPLNSQAQIVSTPCEICPTLWLGFEYHTKNNSCMEKISVERVKNAFSTLFDKSKTF